MLSSLNVSIKLGRCLHTRRSTSDQTISPVHEAYHDPRKYSSPTSITCPLLEVMPRLLKHGMWTIYGRFTPNSNRHALPFRYDRVCWHRDCTGLLHTGISFCPRTSALYSWSLHHTAVSLVQACAHWPRFSTAATNVFGPSLSSDGKVLSFEPPRRPWLGKP